MAEETYYELLQVTPTADLEIITAAYRALIRRHHPDRNPSPTADATTKRLNEAWEILSDPTRRADYDRGLGAQTNRPAPPRRPPSQPAPEPPPPRPKQPTPRPIYRVFDRAPNRTRVDCPHCKQSVIPTKSDALDWITFWVWNLLAGSLSVKGGMCSNCGKPLPANLLGAKRRFSAIIKTTKYGRPDDK